MIRRAFLTLASVSKENLASTSVETLPGTILRISLPNWTRRASRTSWSLQASQRTLMRRDKISLPGASSGGKTKPEERGWACADQDWPRNDPSYKICVQERPCFCAVCLHESTNFTVMCQGRRCSMSTRQISARQHSASVLSLPSRLSKDRLSRLWYVTPSQSAFSRQNNQR